MALGRETPLALWNDISRCPIAVGDLTFAVNRVHIVLKAVPPSCDHPTKWWQVINDKEVISGIGAVPWVIRPFQNVTVRKRLERAVRTVQYRWRARRIARVLRPLLGCRLGNDLCDMVAGYAVGAPSLGGYFQLKRWSSPSGRR